MLSGVFISSSSSSRMRVINHNWSDTKQCLHLQSVAEISRHSVLSGDRIRQCETSSGSRHKDTDQCLQVAISFCRHRSVNRLIFLRVMQENKSGCFFWTQCTFLTIVFFSGKVISISEHNKVTLGVCYIVLLVLGYWDCFSICLLVC